MRVRSVYLRLLVRKLVGLLLVGASACGAQRPVARLNGFAQPRAAVYFARTSDTIEVLRDGADRRGLFVLAPIDREYDNCAAIRRGAQCVDAIAYRVVKDSTSPSVPMERVEVPQVPGTYLLACLPLDTIDTLYAYHPLHEHHPERFLQVVVREDDSYLGYLSELFNTPFILCPRSGPYGHQTDQRVGADCVALAIYGRRRMANPIPFVAPSALKQYLRPLRETLFGPSERESVYRDTRGETIRTDGTESGLRPGDIVHYGVQVSVFLRDAGELGVLDRDDLLLHSREGTGAIVEPMGVSPYANHAFRLYRWLERGNPGGVSGRGPADQCIQPQSPAPR